VESDQTAWLEVLMTMIQCLPRHDAALSGRKSDISRGRGEASSFHVPENKALKIKITVTFTKGAKLSIAVITKHADECNSTW
jgi:hypothetical protein